MGAIERRAGDQSLASLEPLVPPKALKLYQNDNQRSIPAIAKDEALASLISNSCARIPSVHRFQQGDARDLSGIEDDSIELVVTSPPYWTLKEYRDSEDQLGHVEDYEEFLEELDKCWGEVHRVLVPGGRAVIVVGDVNVSRRSYGRHLVFPLHASIQEHCRRIGLDNLAPIIWHKIANAKYEAGGGGFLGKPYEPNAVVKNDIEYILLQRKPGGYRQPTPAQRILSVIPKEDHGQFFRQIWDLRGASTRNHPAPFPVELASRLIRMFSFVGDTVLDPFSGSCSTAIAAAQWGRNSHSIETDPEYLEQGIERFDRVLESSSKQLTVDP